MDSSLQPFGERRRRKTRRGRLHLIMLPADLPVSEEKEKSKAISQPRRKESRQITYLCEKRSCHGGFDRYPWSRTTARPAVMEEAAICPLAALGLAAERWYGGEQHVWVVRASTD